VLLHFGVFDQQQLNVSLSRGSDPSAALGDDGIFLALRRVDSPGRQPRKETTMRHVLMGVLVLMLGGMALAQNRTSSEYCDPWCERDTDEGAALDCSYRTFQQCLAAASGTGHCYENPFLYQCRRVSSDNPLARRRR
jgi:Protein of unknown function (DUF3551)